MPSSAISRATARSFRAMPSLPPRWTNGCSGNSTATSPISRCAASSCVYLGKDASELDPEKVKRGYAALDRMEQHLAASRFLAGD